MPNRRDTGITSQELEEARPWGPGRFAAPEPQARRGPAGSRGVGEPARPRERHRPHEFSGVNPLPTIRPEMPLLKPGDQGG